MVEPVYDQKLGIWKCPECGFTAMSKKVVESHIKQSHPRNKGKKVENKEKANEKKPKKGEWHKYKIGDIWVKVEKRQEVEIHEQGGWRFFFTANYMATLHKKRVRVKLITGEPFTGTIKTRDPYFVTLVLEGGKKLIINKAHILYIEPLE